MLNIEPCESFQAALLHATYNERSLQCEAATGAAYLPPTHPASGVQRSRVAIYSSYLPGFLRFGDLNNCMARVSTGLLQRTMQGAAALRSSPLALTSHRFSQRRNRLVNARPTFPTLALHIESHNLQHPCLHRGECEPHCFVWRYAKLKRDRSSVVVAQMFARSVPGMSILTARPER